MSRIAVIGAGLAGLVVARRLRDAHDVTVFEKSRGPGGRMATRRSGGFEFDHGAQFFMARSSRFQEYLAPLVGAGIVADWNAQFAEFRGKEQVATRSWSESFSHYVGVPGMNAVGKCLAKELSVILDATVASMRRRGNQWVLHDDRANLLGNFDWVVLTAPAPQSARLAPDSSALQSRAASTRMQACFALMLGMENAQDLDWQAALVHDADISWISLNSSKPGRPDGTSFVVHSTNAWADEHIDDPCAAVRDHMLGQFSGVTGIDMNHLRHIDLHGWRYANLERQAGPAYLIDPATRLAACGDWFVRGRVESAFSSAIALTDTIGDHL